MLPTLDQRQRQPLEAVVGRKEPETVQQMDCSAVEEHNDSRRQRGCWQTAQVAEAEEGWEQNMRELLQREPGQMQGCCKAPS